MTSLRLKNAEDILRRAETFAERVQQETKQDSLWREARDLASRISQHRVIHGVKK